MNTEHIVKKALKEGADDVIASLIKEKRKQVKFANNTITTTQTWDTSKLDIFLARERRVASTTIDTISKEQIDKSIKKLIKITKLIKPNTNYFGIADGPFNYKNIREIYDKKILTLNTIDQVEKAINSALKYSKRVAGVLYTNFYNKELASSRSVFSSEKGTSIELSIRAFNKKDESGHAVGCSRVFNGFSPEQIGEKAGMIARQATNPIAGQPGKYDVIFEPLAAAGLLYLTASFASAFMVDAGFSLFTKKINKKVASKFVNLIDDSRIKNGYASSKFDDEGVPAKRTKIIDHGILKTYLHNTSTAKKYKTKTTANAGLMIPLPTNVILEPGKVSKEDLFKGVKNGIYVTNIWYTRFQNYKTGDFSTIPRDGAFLIKDSQIIQPIKGIRIADNLERILKNIIMISKKPEWVRWWEVDIPVLTPYVLVKDVNITVPTM